MLCFFFSPRTCGLLGPWPGIEPANPALESEVSTTGPPGKSQDPAINIINTFLSIMANSWTAINLEAVQSTPVDLTTFRKLFPPLSQNPRVLPPSLWCSPVRSYRTNLAPLPQDNFSTLWPSAGSGNSMNLLLQADYKHLHLFLTTQISESAHHVLSSECAQCVWAPSRTVEPQPLPRNGLMRQWCPGQDDPGHVSTGKPIGFTNQLIGSIMVLPAAGKQVVAIWTRGKSMTDGQLHRFRRNMLFLWRWTQGWRPSQVRVSGPFYQGLTNMFNSSPGQRRESLKKKKIVFSFPRKHPLVLLYFLDMSVHGPCLL